MSIDIHVYIFLKRYIRRPHYTINFWLVISQFNKRHVIYVISPPASLPASFKSQPVHRPPAARSLAVSLWSIQLISKAAHHGEESEYHVLKKLDPGQRVCRRAFGQGCNLFYRYISVSPAALSVRETRCGRTDPGSGGGVWLC